MSQQLLLIEDVSDEDLSWEIVESSQDSLIVEADLLTEGEEEDSLGSFVEIMSQENSENEGDDYEEEIVSGNNQFDEFGDLLEPISPPFVNIPSSLIAKPISLPLQGQQEGKAEEQEQVQPFQEKEAPNIREPEQVQQPQEQNPEETEVEENIPVKRESTTSNKRNKNKKKKQNRKATKRTSSTSSHQPLGGEDDLLSGSTGTQNVQLALRIVEDATQDAIHWMVEQQQRERHAVVNHQQQQRTTRRDSLALRRKVLERQGGKHLQSAERAKREHPSVVFKKNNHRTACTTARQNPKM